MAPVSGLTELKTFSADGRLVARQTMVAAEGKALTFRIDGARLVGGTYLLQLVTPAGILAQKAVVRAGRTAAGWLR